MSEYYRRKKTLATKIQKEMDSIMPKTIPRAVLMSSLVSIP